MGDSLEEGKGAAAGQKQDSDRSSNGAGENTVAGAKERLAAKLAALRDVRSTGKSADPVASGVIAEANMAAENSITEVVQADLDSKRGEVSALTIGRMMGLVTATDLKLLEGKVDLLTTRVSNVLVKLERIQSILNAAPTGADLERVDVQIGSLRTALREFLDREPAQGGAEEEATLAKLQAEKLRAAIKTSKKADEIGE